MASVSDSTSTLSHLILAPNLKYQKNFIRPEWPQYMINKYTYQTSASAKAIPTKIINCDRKFGMSADHPQCQRGLKWQRTYSNSFSLYGVNPNYSQIESKNAAAGLCYSNT